MPAAWRPRVFTYDSLSRLLTAYNPESGTMSYGYDPNGNMTSKTEPAPNQLWGSSPLQQVTITYAYDPLNRLLSKTYPACDPTPAANYRYDYSSFMGQSFAYPVGRLVATLSANGANEFTSYETMGRVAATTECIPGVSGCKTFTAAYDKLGDLTTVGYPANSFSVTYSYDAAARLYDATDSAGINYAHLDPTNSSSFWATGAMKEFTATNFSGFKYHVDYNNRLQPVEIWTGASAASNLFDKRYTYDSPGTTHQNNGNIYTITNVKDSTRTQTFTYDLLNRLISAGDQTHWANQYQYDAWGNMQKIKPNITGENFQISADSSNHLTGYSYDAAGNLRQDGINSWTYVYDSENRITSAGSTSYTYDADGRRVNKSSGTNYWYGPTDAILAETDSAGNWTNYIFFGGQRLARNVSGDIKYYVTDHLHSTGIFADKSGTVLDDNDFYPWGGVVPGVGVSSSNNHYKFTGKERDSESQLDYFGARYYSNGMGRFMSADWAAKPVSVPYAKFGDPQSLNLYAYVENGPINHIDTDGHSYALLDTRNSSGGDTPSFDAEIYFFDHGFDPGASGHRQDESPSTPSTNQPQQPTLNVATNPHTKNQSGLTFPSGGDDIGPVTIDGRGWFWNVLLTGTLPVGADPSQYGIKQSYKDSTKVITQDGKKHNYPSKGTEVLTSNGQWSITKGNTIFAADSPGPHNTVNGDFVDSVTTEIHFKSWVVRGDKRVSDQINWFVKIVVTRGTLDTNASKAGLE